MGWLILTLSFQATDRRDKIFALVGLAYGVDPILVDYSLTEPEVFVQAAAHVLRETQWDGLQMLCFARHHEIMSLPSWVPDWSQSPLGQAPLSARYPYSTPPAGVMDSCRRLVS